MPSRGTPSAAHKWQLVPRNVAELVDAPTVEPGEIEAMSAEVRVVGPDLTAGMRQQLLIPGGTFHVSRMHAGGSYALLGTSEWPGVAPPDVEIGDPEALMKAYPAVQEQIHAFAFPQPVTSSSA